MICPKCESTSVYATGVQLASHPPQTEYECDSCGQKWHEADYVIDDKGRIKPNENTGVIRFKAKVERYFIINFQAFTSDSSYRYSWATHIGESYPNHEKLYDMAVKEYGELKGLVINSIWELSKQDYEDYTREGKE